MSRKKISLIGAGNIGGTIAHILSLRGAFDLVIFDINEGVAKGKALDISQSASILGFSGSIIGTANYQDISESDAIITTAGVPRKPGMSRDDLISINAAVIASVAENIAKYSPKSFNVIITNPLDIMVYHFAKISGLPKKMIVGMAGVLDSARFASFLASHLGVMPSDIKTLVLGGHGDTMVPVLSVTSIAGVPLQAFIDSGRISAEDLAKIIQRTRDGGAEIVGLLGNGSAFYSPAHSGISMVDAFLYDQKKLLPCACALSGEYGYSDIYAGVPCIIGKNGVENIVELPLLKSEKDMFDGSISAVQELMKKL